MQIIFIIRRKYEQRTEKKVKENKGFKDFDLNALKREQAMKDYKALKKDKSKINVERILDRVENHGQNYTEEFLNWIKENLKNIYGRV